MGQYHLTVNLDKKEFLDPHHLGDGLKLREQCGWSPGGTNDALHLLLAVSNGRGSGRGDFPDSEWVGRWGGDRVAVVGDYAQDDDLAPEFEASQIFRRCRDGEGGYRDITPAISSVLEEAYETFYVGTGCRDRISLFAIEGLVNTCSNTGLVESPKDGSRIAVFSNDDHFACSRVRAALERWSQAGNQVSKNGKVPFAELRPFLGQPLPRWG
jgi:hypothetical protein